MRALPTDVRLVELTDARTAERRPIEAMTTLFDLVLLTMDRDQPLPEQLRRGVDEIVRTMTGSDSTVALLVIGADAPEALAFAERIVDQPCRVFTDPRGGDAAALGLTATPGLIWVSTAGDLLAVESGFDRSRWIPALRAMADRWAWTRPILSDELPPIAHPLIVGARTVVDSEEVSERGAAA